MNVNNKDNVATYSMIVCQLLTEICKNSDITLKTFFSDTSISQPTWSRIMKGKSKLTLEDLRNACVYLKTEMATLITQADLIAAELPNSEDIEVVEPRSTKEDFSSIGKTVLTLGALAFLISRLIK